MKKVIFIFALSLLLICFCSAACAEPANCPYDPHLSIMYNNLTDNQRELYDRLYDAIREERESVIAPVGMNREEAMRLLNILRNEAPELCALDSYDAFELSSGETKVRLCYKYPLEEQDFFIEELDALASNFRGLEDEQGILAIREYIINRFEYGRVDDPKVYGMNTKSAYVAMMYNTAVCEGYAETMAMLCHFAGYSCSYIGGITVDDDGNFWAYNGHAWNVACVGTRFIWMDLTWDDGGAYPEWDWYGLDGQTMAETHRPDREYELLVNLRSFLPDDAVVGMYLDINDANGYVRGVLSESGQRVRKKDLGQGQFYTPAMVIYNYGSSPLTVQVSYRYDDETDYWNEVTIKGNSNIAFRTNERGYWNPDGYHEITWYCDGNVLGTFNWTEDW